MQDGSSELAQDRLITRRQLQQLLPVSTTTIWRLEKSQTCDHQGPQFLARD